eukprot:CAMPEP_0115051910 /NCGR_PEP_ID=MMETSP0227-20121206/2622_1 /TAXON_ID=89957 /ORGANISM="Polarella glacialis, Strain CCMP 1383" /LENGTH=59 /DNA_ID=CAMNT_0002435969 /DNA_START=218 /DNA_END=394 /DNA_ORIENTATION=-
MAVRVAMHMNRTKAARQTSYASQRRKSESAIPGLALLRQAKNNGGDPAEDRFLDDMKRA